MSPLRVYTPSVFERVSIEDCAAEVFGTGPEAAEGLARKLNLLNPSGPILVYGAAGGLDPTLRAGQAFVISDSLTESGEGFRLNIPAPLQIYPQASCLSLAQPLIRKEEKQSWFKKFRTHLVDCELGYLMSALTERNQNRVICIRIVIDSATHQLRFLKGFDVALDSLIKPHALWDLAATSLRYISYRRTCRQLLPEVYDRLLNT